MSNKVAVIAGGSRGMGADMADRLGKMGYDVVVLHSKSPERAEAVLQKIKDDYGQDGMVFKCDISDYDDCKAAAEATIERFGRVDVLVNNAGISPQARFIETTPENYRRVINVNLLGHINMCHVFVPHLIKQEESTIINISSVGAYKAFEFMCDYTASKAGIVGFSRSLALELAPYNCRVNCIAPGSTMTDMAREAIKEMPEMIEISTRDVPIKRWAEGHEIADGMEYLINSKMTTGFTLEINGGMHMN